MTWPRSQTGLRGVINAAGRLMKRGVLPGLRRLTVEGVVPGGMSLPRPDAAPQVTPQTSPPKNLLGVWHPAVCPPIPPVQIRGFSVIMVPMITQCLAKLAV